MLLINMKNRGQHNLDFWNFSCHFCTNKSNMIIWWPFCPKCWRCHTHICSKLAFVQPTTSVLLLLSGRKQNVAAFRAQIKMATRSTGSSVPSPSPFQLGRVHILRYCINNLCSYFCLLPFAVCLPQIVSRMRIQFAGGQGCWSWVALFEQKMHI